MLTPRVMLDRGEMVAMRMPPRELVVRNEKGVPIIDDVHRGQALNDRILPLARRGPDGAVLPRDFEFEQRITIHKPIGYFWLIAGLGRLGVPVSVASARMTSSVPAVLTVLIVYLLGARLFSRRAGLIAAVALATSVHFIWIARVATMDMVITFLMTATLALFHIARTSRHRVSACLLMYLAVAAAVLIKGPGYLGIAALTVLVCLVVEYYVIRRSGGLWRHLWGELRRLQVAAGLVIVAALALPWYVAIHFQTGGQWTEVMFLRHHLARFGVYEYGKEFEEKTSPFYYLYKMWPLLFPWVLFLPGAIVEVFRKRSRDVLAGSLFLLAWFGFMLLFFSVMQFRKDEYLIPAYPAIMLLVGLLLDRYLPRGRAVRLDRATDLSLDRAIRGAYLLMAACAAGVVAFSAALHWEATVRLVGRFDDNRNTAAALHAAHRFVRDHGWAVFAYAGVAGVLLGVALWAQFTRRVRLALGVVAVNAGLVAFSTIRILMERVNLHRSQIAFARVVERNARPATANRPGDPIVLFGIESHELVYRLDEDGRTLHAAPGAWEMYDLWPLGRSGRPSPTTAPDRPVDTPHPDSLNVIIAQCRWWAGQGRTPYLVTDDHGREYLQRSPEWQALFPEVVSPDQVGSEYPSHRTPLWLFRFEPPGSRRD